MVDKNKTIIGTVAGALILSGVGFGGYKIYDNGEKETSRKEATVTSISCSYNQDAGGTFEIKLSPGGDLLKGKEITKTCDVPKEVPKNWILSSTPEPLWRSKNGNVMKEQNIYVSLKTIQNFAKKQVTLTATPGQLLNKNDGKNDYLNDVVGNSFPIKFTKAQEDAVIAEQKAKLDEQLNKAKEQMKKLQEEANKKNPKAIPSIKTPIK